MTPVHLLGIVELLGDRFLYCFDDFVSQESFWCKPFVDINYLFQVLLMQELVDDIDAPDVLSEWEHGLDVGLAGNISISVLKWSKVIQDNKLKYEFLRGKLNHEISDDPDFAMDYLMKKHCELFSKNKQEAAHD